MRVGNLSKGLQAQHVQDTAAASDQGAGRETATAAVPHREAVNMGGGHACLKRVAQGHCDVLCDTRRHTLSDWLSHSVRKGIDEKAGGRSLTGNLCNRLLQHKAY